MNILPTAARLWPLPTAFTLSKRCTMASTSALLPGRPTRTSALQRWLPAPRAAPTSMAYTSVVPGSVHD